MVESYILLMIESPVGSDATILCVASNPKEAQRLAREAARNYSNKVRVLGHTIPKNTVLTFKNFLEPEVFYG